MVDRAKLLLVRVVPVSKWISAQVAIVKDGPVLGNSYLATMSHPCFGRAALEVAPNHVRVGMEVIYVWEVRLPSGARVARRRIKLSLAVFGLEGRIRRAKVLNCSD